MFKDDVYILIYTLGSGLPEPSFGALVSHSVQLHEQGRVQDAAQSMESTARIVGPITATYFYGFFLSLPYAAAVLLYFAGFFYLLKNRHSIA